jgi:PAS domain S-box-containing protein
MLWALLSGVVLALLICDAAGQATPDLLTAEERAWLKTRSPLRWSTNINAPPYGFLKPDGHVDGVSPDLMALLERRLGVEFKVVIYGTWSETLTAIKRGDCDFVTAAVPTEDRKQYLLFSQPYQEIPIVLFVNRSATGIDGIKDLLTHRVGVARDTVTHEWIRREHPEIVAVPVESAREGLLLLSLGQLDAVAAGLPLGHYIIMHNGIDNLRVPPSGKLFYAPHCLAVRKSDDRLLTILTKGMDSLPKPELRAVFSKWSVPELEPVLWQPPEWVKNSLVVLLIGYVGFIAWNYSLRSRVARQAKLIRQQMEREHEMERRCAELVESATDMVFTRDLAGNYITINPAGRRLLGYTEEEMKRLNVADVVPPEHMDRVRQQTVEKLTGEPTSVYELEVMTKDRRRLWLEASLRLIYKDGKPVGVQGIARDITKRKQAEEALDREHKFLRTLIDNLPDLVFTKDMEARFVVSNTAHVRFMGVKSEADLAGKSVFDLHPPELARGYYEDDLRVLQYGRTIYNREELVRDHAGMEHWHLTIKAPLRDHNGKIIGLIGVCRDIDEHRRAEEALRQSEETFSTIFHASPAAMSLSRLSDARITNVNARFTTISGYRQDEVVGRTSLEMGIWADAEKRNRFWTLVQQAGRVENIESTLRTKSGELRYGLSSGVIISIRGEEYLLGIFHDITERKQAEDALQKSLEAIQDLYDNAPCGYHSLNAEGVYVQINNTELAWLGYRREELVGKVKLTDLLTPASVRVFEETFPVFKERGWINNIEIEMVRKDGSILPVLLNATAARDDKGGFIMSRTTVVDITERKRADEALRQSEARFRQAVEAAAVPLSVDDMAGTIEYLNRRFIELFGYAHEELRTREDWFARAYPDLEYRQTLTQKWSAALANATSENSPIGPVEAEVTCKDGTIRTVEFVGTVVGHRLLLAAKDLTEHKRAEAALRESEQRLRLAAEAAQMGTWERDLKSNRLFWSATTERLMGYTPGTFPGTYEAFFEMIHPDSRAALAAAQKKARETGEYAAELQFQLPDGRARWGLVRGQVLYDNLGKPDRIVGVDLDITQRKQTEQEIRALNEGLEQRVQQRTTELAASNKELEAFCYSVSHDLRAPLRSIDGFNALVLEKCRDNLDAQSLDYLQRTRDAAQQMGQLINDLLQLSRVTRCELHHEPVDLSALANNIADDLKQSHPDRQVNFAIQPGVVARGDPRLLRVVMQNLLNNAWKFTSLQRQPRVEFGARRENNLTIYFVRDNGAGFDMTYAHKLFAPFQRLHSVTEFPGTGVGLANVQRIVQRHGGRVWAEGVVGHGATFHFTLQAEPNIT